MPASCRNGPPGHRPVSCIIRRYGVTPVAVTGSGNARIIDRRPHIGQRGQKALAVCHYLQREHPKRSHQQFGRALPPFGAQCKGRNCHYLYRIQKSAPSLQEKQTFYEILLEEHAEYLDEISVVASRSSDWYDLLNACRKNQTQTAASAKAYYELKSRINQQQIELVEGFYNARISGYDLKKLDLKAGRLAVQPYEERLFVSLESSRAITMLQLFEPNPLFPKGPLELSRKQLKKDYSIALSKKYKNENLDSVYVLEYTPTDASGHFFRGEIWINYSKKRLLKITQECAAAARHPFKPLFPSDTIRSMDLAITKTFREEGAKVFFNHIDFIYSVDYKDRNGHNYSVFTHAVLYAYELNETFSQPVFEFSSDSIGDYRKINAFPYNAFFWNHHDEPKVSDQQDKNYLFFNDPKSITNEALFTADTLLENGARFLQHPYVVWSDKRVRFRAFQQENLSTPSGKPHSFLSEQYNLGVKIFLDVNTYSDTTHLLSATVFDPYESYYRLPLDNTALCFINIYFDLMEIERRKLERLLLVSDKTDTSIRAIYQTCASQWEELRQRYFKEVRRGENRAGLEKWNKIVQDSLGINNCALFHLYTESEQD
jgi:hypothetical protein